MKKNFDYPERAMVLRFAMWSARGMSANPVDLRAGDGIRHVAGMEKPS
jgi:hypothetical protein